MQPTRVLWVADTVTENAGTERQLVELSRLLHKRLDINIATFEPCRDGILPTNVRSARFPLEAVWSPNGIAQLVRMARFIRSRHIQVVHGFMPKASIAAAVAGRMAGARLVITSRRNLGYHYNQRTLAMMRLTNRFVTRILANSEAVKRVTAEYERVHPDKIDVLYNGVNTDYFSPAGSVAEEPAVAIPEEVRVVGIVANYRPVKDLELFLESAAIVARQVADAHFLLVGSGAQERSLRDLANKLNIGDRVTFTGGRGAVLPYLHRMCIACLSSRSEGFSNSILEYMSVGLPVVATDVGGNAEAIEDGRTGFLVRDRTPEAFAAPIIRMLNDESLRRTLARNGRERCHREFRIEHAANRLAEYYKWLLDVPVAKLAAAGQDELRVP